jgi:hypothetical protein
MVTRDDPTKAVIEAKTFIMVHKLPHCELDMNGFLAYIEFTTRIEEIISEYNDWTKRNGK